MHKKLLLMSALVAISTVNVGTANAVDVTSWSELNDNRNESSIEFQNDITADGGSPYGPYPAPITFTSDTDQVIDGNYHSFSSHDVYLESEARWLYYSLDISKTGGSLSLRNLGEFSDGDADNNTFSYTALDGNTVYKSIDASVNNWKGYFLTIKNPMTVNITNSVFVDNGKDRDARLIYVGSSGAGTLNVKDCIFYNNTTASAGPVINANKFDVNIENSNFYGNQNVKSGDYGGAVYSSGKLAIKDSYFVNNANVYNTTSGKGGAVYFNSGSGHTIENTKFEGNTAGSQGGAVYLYYKATADYIKDSEFIGNTATGSSGGGVALGGGYLRTIDNVLFDGNTSGNKGGGLYVEELVDAPAVTKVTLVKDTIFQNNTATYGGGMYFSSDFGINDKFAARIVDTDFTSNSATQGGGLYIINGDVGLIADNKDVTFSGNTASDVGDDVYFKTNTYAATLFLNAADEKKITFNGTIAAAKNKSTSPTPTIDINKTGVKYSTYDGDTETSHDAGTTGEIQFNNTVGDTNNNFDINLYGGTLSVGPNSSATNPDGLLNDNNFYVKGDSTLSTVNGIIGEFAPKAFAISNGVNLDYQFDVDLENAKSDTITVTDNNGTLRLSNLNVISDTTEDELRIKYSDTNAQGVIDDGYTIVTSEETYDVTVENADTGSYIVFASTGGGGGLPAAIANEANQYAITNGQDEKVDAWKSADGNVITKDMDINGNGYSIYSENGIDGMVVSDGTSVVLRNVKELSGFNNALTNDGGTLSIVDSNVTGNSGEADVTNNGGTVVIDAATKDVTIGGGNTENALISRAGVVEVKGSNKVTFNGNVQGIDGPQMTVSTDTEFNGKVSDMNIEQTAGTVDLKDLSGAVYTLSDGTLNLNKDGQFAPDIFELNNGTINIANEAGFLPQANILSGGSINAINGGIGNLNFNELTLRNTVNLAVDIDLQNEIMDTISANTLNGSGMIKVNRFNVLSDSDKSEFSIHFADGNLKNHVSTDITQIEGKIFMYDIEYDKETGNFNIVGGGSESTGYSPSVITTPIAAQLQGYFTQLNSYDEAFRNMDMYMLLPYRTRQAMKYRNKYAINSSDYAYDDSKTIYDNSTGWTRTHTTFEKVPLKNGPKVGNVAYGIYFGGESELYDLGKGWEGMWGLYAGYNGSHQSYNGVSMYQNGGTLGVLGMAYKGNFFQGLTINTGANGGEANSIFGHEDFAMLMAGVASKTGYNFEFKEGKFIIQPSLLMSYSFVNSFDYTNAAGVHISSDPLHAIQLEPNIKFIANLKNGWQPYASVGMVWSIMDKTHYMANDVSLPELSVKPYVKYGVGIRKTWGERFTGFFQTFLTHGGRNGVGLQVGFRWALGGGKSETKVLNKPEQVAVRKVLKSLTPVGIASVK